ESCIEFKIISRILSGFRTSVAIHLSARYPLGKKTDRFHTTWGINYGQLERRFSSQATGLNGSLWIKDLFFTYTIVHRSLLKLSDTICTKFKNISRILDCVACDKCRLWGKAQVQGLATALKILFTPINGVIQDKLSPAVKLNRMEIVSFSNSLNYLNQWRKYMLLDAVAKSDL
ncbi:hypothetical protein MXB_1252, partial [Myxobolus squamalis]